MDHQSLRKAAVLMRSLDSESAAVLVSRLSQDEARALREAIRQLGSVDDDERHNVLGELRNQHAPVRADAGGVELELSFADLHTEPLPVVAAVPAAPAVKQPFAWLDEGDLPTLAERLAREQLSTVALVMSLLPPHRAGALLSVMPSQLQSDALVRLAEMGEVDPASLELVEADLATWLSEHKATQQRRDDRRAAITAILQHATPSVKNSVTTTLERDGLMPPIATPVVRAPQPRKALHTYDAMPRRDPRPVRPAPPRTASVPTVSKPEPPRVALPEVLRDSEPVIDFHQLTLLDAQGFACVLRECGGEVVVRALAVADEPFHAQLRRWLPVNIRRELEKRTHQLAHVSLRELDDAQRTMTRVAARLAREGRIAWPPGMAVAFADQH